MRKFLIFIIAFYQRALSPLFPSNCRFIPSCSEYAREAIAFHGCIKGSFLALKRIIRCQPFCRGGLDPVPESRTIKIRLTEIPRRGANR